MIYKSTSDVIQELEASGGIRRFKLMSKKPAKRMLFLAGNALKDYDDPNSAAILLCGKGFIDQMLTHWVEGGRIWAQEGKGEFMKRLDAPPPEIWEIRVTAPRPQARLFGRFAAPNALVLTNFHTRPHLKGRGSRNWEAAMSLCQKTWDHLFPEIGPFVGNSVRDYITENCDEFRI